MADLDMHEVIFEWPQTGAKVVFVKGSFDQWSSKRQLTKTATGFVGTIRIPWNKKIFYKYIVDGNWALVDGRPVEVESGTGFINHVYLAPPKPPLVLPESEPDAVIPTTASEDVDKNVGNPISASPASGAVAVAIGSSATEKSVVKPSESSVVPQVTPVDDISIRSPEPILVDIGDTSIADAKSDSGTTAVAEPDLTADILHTPTEAGVTYPILHQSSPSNEHEHKKKSGKPSPLPATPTKGEVFPNVSPPSSPSRFGSFRGSGGKKKRTSSFFARLKEVFKSDKEKEKEHSSKENAETKA